MRGRSGLRRKLASRCGMTLSETLAALAVVSILCAAIVIGTNAAASIYRRSVQLSESQTLLSTLSQSLSGELRFAKNIRTDEGTVVYDSEVFGPAVSVLEDGGDGIVRVGTADKPYELISRGAYTGGLKAAASVSYADGVFTVKLTVTGTVPGERTAEFTVQAMNP